MCQDTNLNWFYELVGRNIHLWQYNESSSGDAIIYPPGDDKWEVKGYSKEIIDARKKGKGRYNYKNTKEYKDWLKQQQENIDRSV